MLLEHKYMNYCFDDQDTHDEQVIFKRFLLSDISKNITPTKIILNHVTIPTLLILQQYENKPLKFN